MDGRLLRPEGAVDQSAGGSSTSMSCSSFWLPSSSSLESRGGVM